MSPTIIAQLIIALGPSALQLIQSLSELWSKPALTPEEVKSLCAVTQKSYDAYLAEAPATLGK